MEKGISHNEKRSKFENFLADMPLAVGGVQAHHGFSATSFFKVLSFPFLILPHLLSVDTLTKILTNIAIFLTKLFTERSKYRSFVYRAIFDDLPFKNILPFRLSQKVYTIGQSLGVDNVIRCPMFTVGGK